jgi:hypothetical protein
MSRLRRYSKGSANGHGKVRTPQPEQEQEGKSDVTAEVNMHQNIHIVASKMRNKK